MTPNKLSLNLSGVKSVLVTCNEIVKYTDSWIPLPDWPSVKYNVRKSMFSTSSLTFKAGVGVDYCGFSTTLNNVLRIMVLKDRFP